MAQKYYPATSPASAGTLPARRGARAVDSADTASSRRPVPPDIEVPARPMHPARIIPALALGGRPGRRPRRLLGRRRSPAGRSRRPRRPTVAPRRAGASGGAPAARPLRRPGRLVGALDRTVGRDRRDGPDRGRQRASTSRRRRSRHRPTSRSRSRSTTRMPGSRTTSRSPTRAARSCSRATPSTGRADHLQRPGARRRRLQVQLQVAPEHGRRPHGPVGRATSPMTDAICYRDAYARSVEATVRAVDVGRVRWPDPRRARPDGLLPGRRRPAVGPWRRSCGRPTGGRWVVAGARKSGARHRPRARARRRPAGLPAGRSRRRSATGSRSTSTGPVGTR